MSVKDELKIVSVNVNDWLKFAETKNTVLLTVNGAGFFVLLQIFNSEKKLPDIISKSLWIFAFFLLVSILIHLFSLLPNIAKHHYGRGNILDPNQENLLFFGSIAKYTAPNYLKAIYLHYEQQIITTYDEHELDLAEQIVINSKITARKFNLFKQGLYCSIFGLAFPIASFISILIGRVVHYW
jgi:hypothetical protein